MNNTCKNCQQVLDDQKAFYCDECSTDFENITKFGLCTTRNCYRLVHLTSNAIADEHCENCWQNMIHEQGQQELWDSQEDAE